MNHSNALACQLLITLLCALGCADAASNVELADRRRPLDAAAPVVEPEAPSDPLAAERSLLDAVLSQPELAGAPHFEERRAEIMARAKGEPGIFVTAPAASADVSADVAEQREALRTATNAFTAVKNMLRKHAGNRHLLRDVLLTQGYLYAEDPDLAFALLSLVGPQHLFSEEEIWIHRGEQVLTAKRHGKSYRFTDGPHAGQAATLMHLDRVGTGPVPPPLHRDIRSLAYRLHFDEARVEYITQGHIVLGLRYGSDWVPSIVHSDGARLELDAELVEPEQRARVDAARAENTLRQSTLQSLRDAIIAEVAERLPFDEPKTEYEQEDGRLRNLWRYAYLEGRKTFEYNDDTYRVFTGSGAPKVPQVCIDFVVDSFERASGTWWLPKGQKRVREVGGMDLRQFGRADLRRTDFFVEFAQEHADWFDVFEVPSAARVPMGNKARFFRYVADNVEQYQPGDVVFVRGYTPWDDEHQHTHAFLIYETDPITRMPIVVAGNAGPANLWSWETEARRTPQRTVRYRVRPRQEWLRTSLLPARARDAAPPLLPTRS